MTTASPSGDITGTCHVRFMCRYAIGFTIERAGSGHVEKANDDTTTNEIPISTAGGRAVADCIRRLQSHSQVSAARRSRRQERGHRRDYGETWRHPRIYVADDHAL